MTTTLHQGNQLVDITLQVQNSRECKWINHVQEKNWSNEATKRKRVIALHKLNLWNKRNPGGCWGDPREHWLLSSHTWPLAPESTSQEKHQLTQHCFDPTCLPVSNPALYLICVPIGIDPSPTCHDLTDFLSSHLIILPHRVTLLKSMYLLETLPHLYLVQGQVLPATTTRLLQSGREFLGENKGKYHSPISFCKLQSRHRRQRQKPSIVTCLKSNFMKWKYLYRLWIIPSSVVAK